MAILAAVTVSASISPGARAQKSPAAKPATKGHVAKAAKPRDAQSTLFLTPGGLYTEADIKANGRKTVAQKYPDFMAEHDAKPKKGQRVCPITDTVANPKLTWVVGGKTYQFCCPPCVTEFVKKAKTNLKAIKAPTPT
jgi:YHS domain-containing protein